MWNQSDFLHISSWFSSSPHFPGSLGVIWNNHRRQLASHLQATSTESNSARMDSWLTELCDNEWLLLFIAAWMNMSARTWKQPRCPSADKWIRKLWYIYTMKDYSAIKKNSFESVLMRWMKLQPIIQSEVSQKDKDQYSILRHIYGI